MKKLIAVLLTLVLTLSLATVAFANPHGDRQAGPNKSPGVHEVIEALTVNIFGNGNSLNLRVTDAAGVLLARVDRPANNRYTVIDNIDGFEPLYVFVRGNSILRVSGGVAITASEPTVLETITRPRYVRSEQVVSRLVVDSWAEVEGSREFIGDVEVASWIRSNQFPGVNGMAVGATPRVSGVLEYEYTQDYVQQFQRWYVTDTINIMSDETEVLVSTGDEWKGAIVDGKEYTEGYEGSRKINFLGDQVVLHTGHGQSDEHGRFVSVVKGIFTVAITLHDTGSTPTITVVITDYDIAAL